LVKEKNTLMAVTSTDFSPERSQRSFIGLGLLCSLDENCGFATMKPRHPEALRGDRQKAQGPLEVPPECAEASAAVGK